MRAIEHKAGRQNDATARIFLNKERVDLGGLGRVVDLDADARMCRNSNTLRGEASGSSSRIDLLRE